MISILMSLFLSLGASANNNNAGKWVKAAPSVLISQGLKIANPNLCEKFELEIAGDNLQYKLRCGGLFSSSLVPLKSDSVYRVERTDKTVTVTKMGYYGHRIQTGKTSQRLVRIPYVEEIIYVSFNLGGQVSFYKEKFIVDDFGRVVQNHFVQAYDLVNEKTKISQNQKIRINYLKSRTQGKVN